MLLLLNVHSNPIKRLFRIRGRSDEVFYILHRKGTEGDSTVDAYCLFILLDNRTLTQLL